MPEPAIMKLPKPFRGAADALRAVPLQEELGFAPQRVYWIYEVPPGAARGRHAHKALIQFVLMLSGASQITIKTPDSTASFKLLSGRNGLLIPPGYWREMSEFSPQALMFVFASLPFDEDDYIRNWSDYVAWVRDDG